MTLPSTIQDFLVYLLTAVAGLLVWLVRMVFTNQKQIALLEQRLEAQKTDPDAIAKAVAEHLQNSDPQRR